MFWSCSGHVGGEEGDNESCGLDKRTHHTYLTTSSSIMFTLCMCLHLRPCPQIPQRQPGDRVLGLRLPNQVTLLRPYALNPYLSSHVTLPSPAIDALSQHIYRKGVVSRAELPPMIWSQSCLSSLVPRWPPRSASLAPLTHIPSAPLVRRATPLLIPSSSTPPHPLRSQGPPLAKLRPGRALAPAGRWRPDHAAHL